MMNIFECLFNKWFSDSKKGTLPVSYLTQNYTLFDAFDG